MAHAMKNIKSPTPTDPSKILMTSQPTSSYASAMGSRARDSLQIVIAGTQQESPYRKLRPSEIVKTQHEATTIGKKIASPRELSNEQNKMNRRSFLVELDAKTISYLCGSPLETRSGARTHRGYSLLNLPPQNAPDHDDADNSSEFKTPQTHKKQKAVTNRLKQAKNSLPDLAFLGYGIEPLPYLTVVECRQKRKNRHLQQQTQRTRVNFGAGMTQNLQSLHSQHHDNTSLTEDNKVVSTKVKSEEVQSQLDSNVFQTQSPRDFVQVVNSNENADDYTSMSVNTRGYQAFMGKSGIAARDDASNWAPFNTQTISIPNSTLEVIGHQTFADGMEPIHVTLDGSIDSRQGMNNRRVLAQSSLETPRGAAASTKSPRRAGDQRKRNTSINANRNSPSRIGQSKKTQPPTKPVASTKVQPQAKKQIATANTNQKQTTSLLKTPRVVAGQKKATQGSSKSPRRQPQSTSQDKSKVVERKLRSNQTSPAPKQMQPKGGHGVPQGTTKSLHKSPIITKTLESRTNKQSPTPVAPKPQHQRQNLAGATKNQQQNSSKVGQNSNRHNKSQDKIMISSKNSSLMKKASGPKQAPPIRPALKRFKTQTKDVEQQQEQTENHGNDQVMEEGGETSLFSEDLSINQAKIEILHANGSGAKLVKLPQTIGLMQSSAVTKDEMGKISDAGGLGGLSIVESDGDGLETPAADRALRGEIGFHSSMRSSHHVQSQRTTNEDAAATPQAIINRQIRTAINIVDTDEKIPEESSDLLTKPRPANKKPSQNYLSSNDSNILAQSITSPFNTQRETQQSNMQGKWKSQNQNKTSKEVSSKISTGVNPTRNIVNYESDQRKQTHRQTAQKRSSHLASPCRTGSSGFQRSVTKDDKMQLGYNLSTVEDKIQRNKAQLQMIGTNSNSNSKPRLSQNMPMQKNSRATQKQQQFVDSDFYENISVGRRAQRTNNFDFGSRRRKMGSTSPVSSRASFTKQQRSLKSRKDREQNDTKSSILMDSDYTLSKIVMQKSESISRSRKAEQPHTHRSQKVQNNEIDTQITKLKEKTEKMMLQSQRRQKVLSHMYQKKFIERREKQVQIINKQANEQSDCDQTKNLAYAIAKGTGYDQSNLQFDEKLRERQNLKLQKRGGLETLRKLHDSLGLDSNGERSSRRIKHFGVNHKKDISSLLNQSVTAQRQHNRSISKSKETHKRNRTQGYESMVDSGTALHPSLVHLGEDSTEIRQQQQRSMVSNATSNNIDQGRGGIMDASNEQAGNKLTSDESGLRKPHDFFIQPNEEVQQAPARMDLRQAAAKIIRTEQCPSPVPVVANQRILGSSHSYMTQMPKPFKIPKIQAPAQWQNICEQKFNLVDGDFVAGKASRSVQKVNMLSNNSAVPSQPKLGQRVTADSPRVGLNYKSITDRKKSHELTSVRNKATTDEDRIKKLTNFSLARQLEHKRQHQQFSTSTGRDDPGNLVGYQKIKKAHPSTLRGGRNLERRTVAALQSGHEQTMTMDSMTTTTQKNIYSMLSDLNRVKTMRIANQVLKDQQQVIHSANKQRREQINSQGSANVEYNNNNISSYTNLNRPQNLQISANYGSIAAMMSSSHQSPHPISTAPVPDFNHLQIMSNASSIMNSSNDFKEGKGIMLTQGQQRTDPIMVQESNNSYGAVTLNKPQTPLSNMGLRIMQTNKQ